MAISKTIGFLETRNQIMKRLGCNRRVATLATRLSLGVDTWESIAMCPTFRGRPLLNAVEIMTIRLDKC